MMITAVLTTYGNYPPTWIGPCLESLVEPGGIRDVVVVTDHVNPGWARWAARRQVALAAVKITANGEATRFRQFADSPELCATARLVAWRVGLRLVAPGTPFVALDVDTLVRRPLGELFQDATPPYFGLALPRTLLRSGRYRYRSSVVAGQATPMVDRYLDDWIREVVRMGAQRTQLQDLYGSLESAAWHHMVARAEEAGGIVLAHLPPAWCAEAEDGDTPTGIAHFKGVPPALDQVAELAEPWLLAGKRSGL